jgi:hypothetical protein
MPHDGHVKSRHSKALFDRTGLSRAISPSCPYVSPKMLKTENFSGFMMGIRKETYTISEKG